MFAPTIGFAGLLRSLDRGSYSVLMVSGSEGSAGLTAVFMSIDPVGSSRSGRSIPPRPRA
jgi:hypothetical protein